jgi:hypothetical protein
LLNSKAGILLNWAVFGVLDPCGEGSSGFLFTEHLVSWCKEILSIEKPDRNFDLQRKKLNQEKFSPSS